MYVQGSLSSHEGNGFKEWSQKHGTGSTNSKEFGSFKDVDSVETKNQVRQNVFVKIDLTNNINIT